ncbi:B12-binding domain-containing radical SAM protein [Sodalis sp. RH14]|uniref:B12-binding domain-containing radical SAM protein n=1 Tax=Sodalis sp. RH14 TaxID=3394329 RepID=UPI0039B4C4DB
MRIALINPQTETVGMRELYDQYENLALALIAAQLRPSGHSVELYDLRVDGLTESAMAQLIAQEKFALIGFSVNYATLHSALRISQRLALFADPKPFIVLGGEHVSYEDVGILSAYPSIDAICRGEGEITFHRMVDALSNGFPLNDVAGITWRDRATGECRINANRAANNHLDGLCFAAHDIALKSVRTARPVKTGILMKRGCPYPCVFCNAQRFLGNESTGIRARSPANVVKEMAAMQPLVKQTRGYLHIFDATFVTPARENRAWIEEFCDEMERRSLTLPLDAFIRADSVDINKPRDRDLLLHLRSVGLISTYLGLEAGDNEQLDLYNKKIVPSESSKVYHYLKSLGMTGSTNGCITFFQDVTLRQIQNSVLFLYGVGLASLWNIASRAETLPGIRLNHQTRVHERHVPWDVENYHFKDDKVATLYAFIRRIIDRYEIIRLEDRMLREIRDAIKVTQFYCGITGYSHLEKAFDQHVSTIQGDTVEFVMGLISELSCQDTLSDRLLRAEYNYIARLEENMKKLFMFYGTK